MVTEWEVEQRVRYTYIPAVPSEVVRKFFGTIVFVGNKEISIRWDGNKSPIPYAEDSHIAKYLDLITELSESNPNKTFVKDRTFMEHKKNVS